MTTSSSDHSHAGWRKFDIDCQDGLPVSIAFIDNGRTILSCERNSDHPGGRVLRYKVTPDSAQRNTPQNLDAIPLNAIDLVVVSKDGSRIVNATGTSVMVRNMITEEVAEVDEHTSGVPVYAVDLSPDATKFATGSEDKTVRVFNTNTKKLLLKLNQHNDRVLGVKFSPNGKHLATAAFGDPVRVWDALDGHVIFQTSNDVVYGPGVSAQTAVPSPTSIPLGWSNDSERVFTVSSGKVMMSFQPPPPTYGRQDPGPTVVRFKQSVPASDDLAPYSLTTNGRIIACAAGSSLSFWDSFSKSKMGPTIAFQDSILSVALSSDGSYLACGGGDKKIMVYLLRDILPVRSILDPTYHIPYISVDHTTFTPWVEGDFSTADSRAQHSTRQQSYRSRATQALIQVQYTSWYGSLESARKSLASQQSIIGYIALVRALLRHSQPGHALEAFDAVFRICGADENRFLLLIKAIFLFLSKERENAVTRVQDLISTADNSEKYDCLQVLGNMYLIQGDSSEAFKSFERARSLSFYRQGHHLMTILLIFGRSFEERDFTLRHPLRD